MMSTYCSEHTMIADVIMPFLSEHWDEIDMPEINASVKDGRLDREELAYAYQLALAEKRSVDAYILDQILIRYDKICFAYEDGYYAQEEALLGISEADISVYEQLVSPEFESSDTVPKPKYWI